MEKKLFRFELKELDDDTGLIEGHLSVKENVDLGNERVKAGAFKRTLGVSKGRLPMLFAHKSDEPIGMWTEMVEDAKGLAVKGKINLEVQRGREIYALLKQGAIKGLSIGYDVVKEHMEKGVRELLELKLWEGSVVVFPMNELASVESVKSALTAACTKYLPNFDEANEYEQVRAAKYVMIDVLARVLSSVCYETEMTADEIKSSVDTSLTQFHTAAMEWVDKALVATEGLRAKSLALPNDMTESHYKLRRTFDEAKALLDVQEPAKDPGVAPHSEALPGPGLAADAPADSVVADHSGLIDAIRAATPTL